jgi:hypothetical protein
MEWGTAPSRRIFAPSFVDREVSRDQCGDSPLSLISVLDDSRYFIFQTAPHLSSRGWVDPVSDPILLRKSDNTGNRTRDLQDCSQELWPLDTADVCTIIIQNKNRKRCGWKSWWPDWNPVIWICLERPRTVDIPGETEPLPQVSHKRYLVSHSARWDISSSRTFT